MTWALADGATDLLETCALETTRTREDGWGELGRGLDLVMAIAIMIPFARAFARSLGRACPALPCPPALSDRCLSASACPLPGSHFSSCRPLLSPPLLAAPTHTRIIRTRPLLCVTSSIALLPASTPSLACHSADHGLLLRLAYPLHHISPHHPPRPPRPSPLAPSLPAAALACFGSPPGPPSLCSATSLTLPPTLPVAEHPASLTPQPPTAACVAPTALTTAWLLKTILRVTSVHPRIKPAWPPPLGPWSDKSPVPPVYQLQSSVLMPDLADQPSPPGFAFSPARNTTAVGRIACLAVTDSTSANG
jgi:hypothetical protein